MLIKLLRLHWNLSSLVQIMVCRYIRAGPFYEAIMPCCQFDVEKQVSMIYKSKCSTITLYQHIEAEADILTCIFLNENAWISLIISLKFVPKVRINNIPALLQITAWCRPGDESLSEPMMVSLLTHLCVTRSEWVSGNAFEEVIWEMSVISIGPYCVNAVPPTHFVFNVRHCLSIDVHAIIFANYFRWHRASPN